jgi:hypothetical protein
MKESSTDLIESAAQGSNVEMKENVQSCSSPKSTFDFGSFGGIPESQSRNLIAAQLRRTNPRPYSRKVSSLQPACSRNPAKRVANSFVLSEAMCVF